MIVTVNHIDSCVDKKYHSFYNDYIKFLQKEYPLKENIYILFLGKKDNSHMSTGSRNKYHELKILTKGRINRDILRTLSHEWIHEYHHSILKRKKGPDIGGRNENEANAIAGILIKKFEKKFPKREKLMYKTNQ